jgi:hypothetical protein
MQAMAWSTEASERRSTLNGRPGNGFVSVFRGAWTLGRPEERAACRLEAHRPQVHVEAMRELRADRLDRAGAPLFREPHGEGDDAGPSWRIEASARQEVALLRGTKAGDVRPREEELRAEARLESGVVALTARADGVVVAEEKARARVFRDRVRELRQCVGLQHIARLHERDPVAGRLGDEAIERAQVLVRAVRRAVEDDEMR